MKALFDTNILIDYLSGIAAAATAIDDCSEKLISRITWMEVLVGVTDPADGPPARQFLDTFRIVELCESVAEGAVTLRKSWPRKLKLPDAIIHATAKTENCPLITRNTRDFDPAALPDVVMPYSLGPPA